VADSGPLLSVIITSYAKNRPPDVFDLLESLKAQTYPHLEIVFVGEREPELCAAVAGYAQGDRKVKVLFNEGPPGATWARNLGVGAAEGEILAFVDDDALPFPDWAEALVKTYKDPSIVGVTGPILPLWEDEAMEWFPQELDWVFGCATWSGITETREVRSVNGINASFRRQALAMAGPYSVALGPRKADRKEWSEFGEETELSLRVTQKTGKRIVHNTKVRVYHRVPRKKFRWGFLAQRAYQVGRTRRMIKRLCRHHPTDVLSTERQLLRRILFGLIPGTVKQLSTRPVFAGRRLAVTGYVLFFVALGYYAHLVSRKALPVQEVNN